MGRVGILTAAAALLAGVGAARADCGWSIGMLEADLRDAEIAAPLATDPNLPLGPEEGGVSGSSGSLSEGAGQASPAGASFSGGDPQAVQLRLERARSFVGQARNARIRGAEDACLAAVGRAREALQRAAAAFPKRQQD